MTQLIFLGLMKDGERKGFCSCPWDGRSLGNTLLRLDTPFPKPHLSSSRPHCPTYFFPSHLTGSGWPPQTGGRVDMVAEQVWNQSLESQNCSRSYSWWGTSWFLNAFMYSVPGTSFVLFRLENFLLKCKTPSWVDPAHLHCRLFGLVSPWDLSFLLFF